MKIKSIFFLFFFFLLTSCWETAVEEDSSGSLTLHTWSGFSINMPSSWEIIQNKDKILPKPSFWEIEFSVKSKSEIDNFFNNMLILSWELDEETSSKNYSIENNIWAKKEYMSYKLIIEKDFNYNDGELSRLYVFNARYNSQTPLLSFLQTTRVCSWIKAYLITIALPANVEDINKYEELIKSFTCLE